MHEGQRPCGANKQKWNEHDVESLLLLVPQCEGLRTCCSAFLITTKWRFNQDVKVVPGITFTKRTRNGCVLLQKQGDAVASSELALH